MAKGKTISVKDLTLCQRKKVFSTIDPLPMTNAELYKLISGQTDHDIIERHFMLYPDRFKSEMQIRYKQVTGKIDIYDKKLSNVLDIKTSKSNQILLDPFKFHVEQVKYYMAMINSDIRSLYNNKTKRKTEPLCAI
jgi:hypothetical protein